MALPLENIRVLDLTRALAGPFCTMILGDMGAEVIKVEPAPKGEMIRGWAPFDRGVGVYYLSVNRNKRSLAVDFRKPEALALLRRLAAEADVLVENFKPGSAAKMGLDYASLKPANPGLVHASLTGFGSRGPYGNWPGYDQIAQGMSGMMSISGFPDGPPTRLGVPLGDLVAGMWGAIGVLSAIVQRQATGLGQQVEANLLGGLIGLLCVQGQRTLSLGEVPGRIGNDHPVIYPYGAFQAADGMINVAAATEAQWRRLCEILGASDLLERPEFSDNTLRSENRAWLKPELDRRLAARPAAEWSRELMEAGIPTGPVYTLDQVFSDPHVLATGMTEEIEHPTLGMIRLLAGPARLEAHEGRTVRSPPPILGQHSRAVLEGFGLDRDEIAALIASGAVMEAEE
jgi:crotonobetainyl-CoA:carnitine CoA-transferase CaiB-like acyl-CoA transferase